MRVKKNWNARGHHTGPAPFARNLTILQDMEVTEQHSRSGAWTRMDTYSTEILEEWLPKWLVCKTRGIIAGHEMLTPDHVEATEALAEKHLTEAQHKYARRVFRDGASTFPATWPWPVPCRVNDQDLIVLILCVQREEMSCPKAWAAVRLLSAAALIEASRRTMEDQEEAPNP